MFQLMNSDIIGTGAGGIQIRYCYFVADTVTDLPAANYYESGLPAFTIGQGSDGYCIDDASVRIMDGSGAWQLKTAGTAAYTKAEVDTLLAAKQDVLTFDATPTENSTNPVMSGGVWSPLAELVDAGAKNCLMFDCVGNGGSTWGSTYTHNGITYTITGDGEISVYGTASENSFGYLGLSSQSVDIDGFCNGLYVLSGCPSGGSTSTWRLYVLKSGYGYYSDTGEGILLPDRASYTEIRVCCWISKGTTIPQNNPLIFKPMICTLTDWNVSHAYQPYRPSYQELYEMILALQSGTRSLSMRYEPAAEPDEPEESEER